MSVFRLFYIVSLSPEIYIILCMLCVGTELSWPGCYWIFIYPQRITESVIEWQRCLKNSPGLIRSGAILAAERGRVSKILPQGPSAKPEGQDAGFYWLSQAIFLGSSFLFFQNNVGTIPFLINIVSSSNNRRGTSHPNKCKILPY